MRGEPHASLAALNGALEGLEPPLDALPTALLLLVPGSGSSVYANRAAHALAGGAPEEAAVAFARAAPAAAGVVAPCRTRRSSGPGRTARAPSPSAASPQYSAARRQRADIRGRDLREVGRGGAPSCSRRPASSSRTRSSWSATLDAVARATVPAFADWCFVELLAGRRQHRARALIEHRDPSKRPFIEALRRGATRSIRTAPFGSAAVIRTGEPALVPELDDEMLAGGRRGPGAAAAAAQRRLPLVHRRAAALGRRRDRRPRARAPRPSAARSRRTTSRSRRSWPTAARWPSATRGSTPSCATPNARRDARATSSRRSPRDPDAVIAQGPDGQVVYANAAALELLGYRTQPICRRAGRRGARALRAASATTARRVAPEQLPGRRALAGETRPDR